MSGMLNAKRYSVPILSLMSKVMEKLKIVKIPANIYLFSASDKNARKMCEICSKLTIKPPKRRGFVGFIVNSEHILHLFLVFLLLIFNKKLLSGIRAKN